MMDNKYGYCKAIDKKTGRTVEGYFAVVPFCTYCFKEDYEAHPDNDREYVVCWESGDWGLPNTPCLTEIVPGSMKRYIGKDKRGRKVFEDDFVRFVLRCQGQDFPITIQMYHGDWERQYRADTFYTMWYEERNLWLCDGELVLGEE